MTDNTVAGKDLTKALRPVKDDYHENPLTSDNKIFINKLNHICENYDKNTEAVSFITFLLTCN